MSQETIKYLNENTLIGFTANRNGEKAWHYRFEDQPEGGNHFEGAIPFERAEKLFGYDVHMCEMRVTHPVTGIEFTIPGLRAAIPDDQEACYGVHSDGYQPHQLRQWLIENIKSLISDHAGLGTLGKLRNGAQAFASIEVPETYKTPQGVNFRPYLLATTSFDGKLKTLYKLVNQLPVCDNTVEIGLKETGLQISYKHTKNSVMHVTTAQEALSLIELQGERFSEVVKELCERDVTEAQFQAFMSKLVPLPEKGELDINKRDYSTRTATIAANKREKLNELYRSDGRVAPWAGTAFGVLQMVNTYQHHVAGQRGASEGRFMRNMENVLNGSMANNDKDAIELLAKICNWERELVLVAA